MRRVDVREIRQALSFATAQLLDVNSVQQLLLRRRREESLVFNAAAAVRVGAGVHLPLRRGAADHRSGGDRHRETNHSGLRVLLPRIVLQ